MYLRPLLLLCLLIILSGVTFAAWRYQPDSNTPLTQYLPGPDTTIAQLLTPNTDKKVSTPPPLRSSSDKPGGTLTTNGVLNETNRHRAQNNLPPLKNNATLNQAAANKLSDMFDQQYFEHISPSGRGPADIVDEAGYEYLSTGENLALGNFAGDTDLVQTWMDSPGHRDNILNPSYTELGIAVKPDMFEGQQTWLAVQTFALPTSACPPPDNSLKVTFDQKKASFEQLQTGLNTTKESLGQRADELLDLTNQINNLASLGHAKINEGNEQIAQGNNLAQETKSTQLAQTLWDQGQKLQTEGQALIDEARDTEQSLKAQNRGLQNQQDTYNHTVSAFNQLNDELGKLVEKLNSQINAFNECIKAH